ncbi:MAG: crossover junction endodeoxyribonuclease RuvC [Verrucomicrobiota bacterium]|nr:crossover junction endodeoxyribonuclease RuvC [Verrucomicrobiota bacterium]
MGISSRAYAELEARLRRQKERSAPQAVSSHGTPEGVVLGLDPSLRGTGYGLVERKADHLHAVAFGVVRCPRDWSRTACLATLVRTLHELVAQHRPQVAVLEGLFHARNVRTALVMGEARGAALGVLAGAGLEIYEIPPRRVKLAITGHGAAGKQAVARMVTRLLDLTTIPGPDEADALALAVAHWQSCCHPWATVSRRI